MAASTVAAWPKSRWRNVQVGAGALLGARAGLCHAGTRRGLGHSGRVCRGAGRHGCGKETRWNTCKRANSLGGHRQLPGAASTAWPTCCWKWSRRALPSSMPPPPWTAPTAPSASARCRRQGHHGPHWALVAGRKYPAAGGIGMTWELPLSHYAKRLVSLVDHQFICAGDEDHRVAWRASSRIGRS